MDQLYSPKSDPGWTITTRFVNLREQDQTPSPSRSPPHNITWTVLGLLIAVLPLKYNEAKESLFDTHFVTIVAFVLITLLYGMILHVEKKLETQNPDTAEVIGYCSHLCEFLAIVLLLLMPVLIVGWIFFVTWVCCLAMVAYLSYSKVSEKLLRDRSTLPISNKENRLCAVVEQK